MKAFLYFAVFFATAIPGLCHAIAIEQSELNAMQNYAAKHGTVPVLVKLPSTKVDQTMATSIRELKKIEDDFFNEIGEGALAVGRESLGFNRLSVQLTLLGIQRLSRSKIAIAAWQGPDWIQRSIDAEFTKSKFVQVEFFPAAEGSKYTIASNGQVEITRGAAVDAAVEVAKVSLKNEYPSAKFLAEASYGAIRMEVSRDDLISIVAQKTMKHIRLATQPSAPSSAYDADLELCGQQ